MSELRPLEFLLPSCDKKIPLMILNQPLSPQLSLFKAIWSKAVYKVAVDGGINEIYRCMSASSEYIPDLITGDFDSADPDIVNFYKEKGSVVEKTPDQDYTDFTKSIKIAVDKTRQLCIDYTVVLGAIGGRLDQTFANIHTLYEVQSVTNKPVILMSEGSLATLLTKGNHKLLVDTGREYEWCGLVPIGTPCLDVTTTGLKWNLNNQILKFGQLISTSNTYDGSGVVTIETDKPLIWTMGYQLD